MKNSVIEPIRLVMEEVAEKNGMTLRELQKNIRFLAIEGRSSIKPEVRQFWRRIPTVKDDPVPEIIVGYLVAVSMGWIRI